MRCFLKIKPRPFEIVFSDDDPVRFAEEVIGIEPDEWQVELLDAVSAPAIRRVSVRSGHGVGKSTGVAMAALWHVLMRVPSKTVVTAPTSAQLFDALFAEMKALAKKLKPPFDGLLTLADMDELLMRADDEDSAGEGRGRGKPPPFATEEERPLSPKRLVEMPVVTSSRMTDVEI